MNTTKKTVFKGEKGRDEVIEEVRSLQWKQRFKGTLRDRS